MLGYALYWVALTKKKILIKNLKCILHSLYVLEPHQNRPEMLNILEDIRCFYK